MKKSQIFILVHHFSVSCLSVRGIRSRPAFPSNPAPPLLQAPAAGVARMRPAAPRFTHEEFN